ncbi:hypothetical protein LTR84_004279 [Exophiala bonariae]|uniref:NAD-dependent epimerase/dehydratase domain-containing protein n=1 Tax=Exophiala bonariae TaxID=1690606 RepID=A0AAV9N472_9EURO|nr:hypothetical protein LTR84_004279 [Exophiala bonariae]
MPIENPALPPDSIVLITGVNGLVGSHVADQVLLHGYRVRGVVRNLKKHEWMIAFFASRYGADRFSLTEIADLTKAGAFVDAVKGVAGVMHVASPVDINPDPDVVIPIVVDSTLNALTAASDEAGTVKRFVLTSSGSAVVFPKPNHRVNVTAETWNEESVRIVQDFPADMSVIQRGFVVYMASKVKGEQALWNWVKENPNSSLAVNAVLPGGAFGPVLSPEHQGYPSTTGLVAALFTNNTEIVDLIIRDYAPEYFVDIQDVARLHVAALLHPDVKGERIFAYNTPFNWNTVLGAFRKLYPERTFRDDEPGLWDDLSIVEPAKRAEALLREMGREGFTGLEESLRRNVQEIVDADGSGP